MCLIVSKVFGSITIYECSLSSTTLLCSYLYPTNCTQHFITDKLQARATFADGEAMKQYLEDAKVVMNKMNEGPAKVQLLEFHGPSVELEKVKAITPAEFHPQFFEAQAIEAEAKEKVQTEIKAPPAVEGSADATTKTPETPVARSTRAAKQQAKAT